MGIQRCCRAFLNSLTVLDIDSGVLALKAEWYGAETPLWWAISLEAP